MSLSSLNDRELLASLESLCRREREITLDVLRHLNEVERRRLHLRLGHSSMFGYCTQALRYSESAAGRRIAAARCMRRVPRVEVLLERREISLMSLGLIAGILTDKNATDLLDRVRGKSKLEVARIVAEYRPEIVARDRVRPIRVSPRGPQAADAAASVVASFNSATATSLPAPDGAIATPVHATPSASPPTPAPTNATTGVSPWFPSLLVNEISNSHGGSEIAPTVPPRAVAMLQLNFAVTPEFMAMYHQTCALLSNKIGKATFATVFQVLMEDYHKRHSPRARHARREQRMARKAARAAAIAPR